MQAATTRFFALVLALGLCACTAVRWQKADGNNAALAQDLAACHKQAQDKVGGIASSLPSPTIDPRFGPPIFPSPADVRMQEGQALGVCMRQRGYVLVPSQGYVLVPSQGYVLVPDEK